MVDVAVESEDGIDAALCAGVEAVAERALALIDRSDAELSVVLCDDAFIRRLNRQWRGTDAATDVLSFPQGDEGPGGPGPVPLGDVVISVPTASRQAESLGHPVEQELVLLLVHGLLHLLGHDHEDPDEAARMQAEEARMLQGFGGHGVGLVGRVSPQE